MGGWDIDESVLTWNKFCIQLYSSFGGQYVDKSQIIQAYPPSEEYPLGHCNAVLLHCGDSDMFGMNQVITFFSFIDVVMLGPGRYQHRLELS